jgi:hypothetical protein
MLAEFFKSYGIEIPFIVNLGIKLFTQFILLAINTAYEQNQSAAVHSFRPNHSDVEG